jgi:hypothetical protein
MHKDLDEKWHHTLAVMAQAVAHSISAEGQSLALARQAWLSAFDAEAERLDAGDQAELA